VIASPALSETAGNAAVYAGNARELVQAMLDALERPAWRAEWSARARVRAAEFSWRRTALETYAVYEEARRRFGK
jgi:glycosyltransferase involved in cell wall biosynthesis